MENEKTLVSERLYLKRLNCSYVSDYYTQWLNDAEVNRFLETKGGYTKEGLACYLKKIEKDNILAWAIHLKSDGRHIGNIKIDPINERHRHGEYGILIGDKGVWGKGYGEEASKSVFSHVFTTPPFLRKVTLGVVKRNNAAVKLYAKMGFVIEGIYKSHALHSGEWHDVLRMSLFKESYEF